jgi:hypothetical protein
VLLDILEINNLGLENLNAIIRKSMNLTVNQRVLGSSLGQIPITSWHQRILKSHLHMREHNLHRQRIANSMASFAESAMNNDQRDVILSRLVDSIATFGISGMLGNEDDGGSKITIDNITRTLGALKTGGN